MKKECAGSMVVMILIVLGVIGLSIIGAWHTLTVRHQIIVISLKTEFEERLCAAIAEIGIMLARQELPEELTRSRVIRYKVPVPTTKGQGYEGRLALTVGQPMVSLEATLYSAGKRIRAVLVTLTYDKQREALQVLEWLSLS